MRSLVTLSHLDSEGNTEKSLRSPVPLKERRPPHGQWVCGEPAGPWGTWSGSGPGPALISDRPGKRPQQSRGWRGPGETGTPALAVSACDGVAVAVAWGPGPQEKLRTERPRGRQSHSGVCPRTRNRSLRARSAPRVHHCAATAQAPAAAGGTGTQVVRATEYYSALKKVEGLAACNGCMNLEAVMPREVGHRRRRKAARRSSNEDIKRPNPGARELGAGGCGWGAGGDGEFHSGATPFQPRDKGGVSERSFPPVPRSL